jgi:glycosyltransferase involved in cell wall biosynthesis
MPKVSVILTSLNHAKFLRDSIDSVLSQTFPDFELIIWDDASTDESWAIINEYKDTRIHPFRNEERMGSEVWGMNKAIAEVAQGEFIAIHHSDDIWESEKLEKQVVYLDSHPEIGAVFSSVQLINEEGESFTKEDHHYCNSFNQPNRTRHEWLRYFFKNGNALWHPTVLIRKLCHEECGMYRECFFQTDDTDMWIRLFLKYEIHILPEKLVRFRIRDNGVNISGNRSDARIRYSYEFYKLLQIYRQIKSFDELIKVFPSAEKYDRKEETDMDFVLGMVALEESSYYHVAQLFGQDLLFEAVSDPKRAINIKRLYDFDCKSLIALTGQNDVFSIEAYARILSSHSWRLTRPLRFFARIIQDRGFFGKLGGMNS